MKTTRRTEMVKHLSEDQIDEAIDDAQKADETRLVRRLCFIKNVFLGDTDKMAVRRVGASQPTGGPWFKSWNEGGVDRLRPNFADGGRILIVADDYGSHHAKLTQRRADELGIEFVFIPPFSPTLNAIEPL